MNLFILYIKQYIYLRLKQNRISTLCEFIQFKCKIEKYASIQKVPHSIFENWLSTWKDKFISDPEGQNV